jgi:protease YdgD
MRWHRFRVGLLCTVCFFVPGRTLASDLHPGIFGSDDRKAINQLTAPWTAIGQVNVSGYRQTKRCTGTLIASNVVLTAAHCIMDPWRRKPFPNHQIHFLAGVRGSDWLGHSTAKCVCFPLDYGYGGSRKAAPRRDVALIVLKDELHDINPLKISVADARSAGMSLVHASYAADRRYRLTAHSGCHLLSHDQGLWLTDCDTHPASSGGPVLLQTEDGLRLAAIMVGVVKDSASIAVPAQDWLGSGRTPSCP